jgi:hypothetical protein
MAGTPCKPNFLASARYQLPISNKYKGRLK